MEIVSEGAKVTEQALLFILKSLVKFLEDGENKDDVIISDNTKEGKQKINDLIKKHKSNVYALDENLTKEQLKDYQREFKKLGVDFSVTKNGKDSYSFFFAGQQANIIEKALKNVSELKSAVLENEAVRKAEKELTDIKNNLGEDNSNKVKELYDSISENNELIKKLNPEELELFEKYKSVDNLKLETKEKLSKELNVEAEKFLIPELKNLLDKQQTNFNSKEEHFEYIFNQLNSDEKELFKQLNDKNIESLDNAFAEAGYSKNTESIAYNKLKDSMAVDSIKKVENLYEKHIYSGSGSAPENKIHMDNFRNLTLKKEHSKDKVINDTKKFSIFSEKD
ncbi:DUF3801 domain-containing protein [Carnobacterium maltaromaticum]|uniref:DUF3801 domain-containing protein n=1 Tax=Carnobacterium maltaromaticum TaxID=2751 RepID=UPI0039BE88AB